MYAHRYSVELTGRVLQPGEQVLHRCDNPPCVNPAHLFIGTHADNMADMAAKGRQGEHARPGKSNGRAVLTPAQVVKLRSRYFTDGIYQHLLAAEFGISQTQVSRIVRKEQWK